MIGGLATLQVFRSLIVGNTPVVLGGDNSFSAFTISAAARKFIREGKTPGLLYIDAHLDVHTEKTTWTGHAHGMPLAAVVGEGRLAFRSSKHYLNKNGELRRRIDRTALSPQNVIHIGAGSTDIEPEEFAFIDKHRIRMYDLKSLREAKGWNECFNEISRLASRVDKLIVMLDLDVFHQSIAPGVAYQSESGLTSAEWPQLIDHIRASAKGKIAHVEIMEYNPSKDVTDEAGIPKTARLASEVLTRLIT
jgi:arginase